MSHDWSARRGRGASARVDPPNEQPGPSGTAARPRDRYLSPGPADPGRLIHGSVPPSPPGDDGPAPRPGHFAAPAAADLSLSLSASALSTCEIAARLNSIFTPLSSSTRSTTRSPSPSTETTVA